MGRFVGVGLIGHGFMGKAHSLAWRNITLFTDSPLTPVLKAVAGRSEDALRGFAAKFGFERYYTDYRLMIKDPGIDIIDNVTKWSSLAIYGGVTSLCGDLAMGLLTQPC